MPERDRVLKAAYGDEVSLAYDAFRPHRDAQGNTTSIGCNNMWIKCILAPYDADSMSKAQFRGKEIIDAITNGADRTRMEALITEHTRRAQGVLDGRSDRADFIFSEETNKNLYEIYRIARKYGVSNGALFR